MKEFLAFQEARMDSFLQHSEEKVDAQRSALRQMTEHFAGIATNISNTVAHWLGHPAAHQGAHLYEELNLAHKRYIDAEGQYQELKIEYQNLQKQLQEANAKLAEAVEERNELRKIADIANWTGATKVSDDTIRSKWKQLDYNIRAMARALAKCQTKCSMDNVNKARFESIVSSWPKLLENDDYKELLIAAYLWTLVNEEIFQHGDKFWGGGLIRGLKSIRAHLVGKCRHNTPNT
jgi:chromosome segregation ATPase